MSRTKLLLIVVIVLIVGAAIWLHLRNSAPPAVAFAKVQRETLVSSLPTNGKVEPSEWASVRAERAGTIGRVAVQMGQRVAKGQMIAELDTRDARAAVAAGEAAVAGARAQLQTITQGGTPAAHVEIDTELERNRMDLKAAQRDYDSVKRLAAKQAATQQEVTDASERVQKLQAAIQALERKRGALVSQPDRSAAAARLNEAQATLDQARAQLERSRLVAPMAGIVYELPVRNGAYLSAGDLVANVGNLSTLRVRIYVDEPELGRVSVGMPVAVTWDALPGRTWKGAVEKMPAEVVALGTRQVGEVICTIGNDDLRLLPGTNVNIEITSQVVENGLTIPKEAIRTENAQTGVYVFEEGRAVWHPIRLGASSVTRAAVSSGLQQGDLIALRTEQPLHNGDPVRQVSQ